MRVPKKVPLKQVAKVSDRISSGFEYYDAATSSSSSSSSSSGDHDNKVLGSHKIQWQNLAKRAISFSGSKWIWMIYYYYSIHEYVCQRMDITDNFHIE